MLKTTTTKMMEKNIFTKQLQKYIHIKKKKKDYTHLFEIYLIKIAKNRTKNKWGK